MGFWTSMVALDSFAEGHSQRVLTPVSSGEYKRG
jgi:hypothetical protein